MSGPRVLIVKTSSMGDVVHTLPMATDIARARPDATIDWIVEEGFAAIPRLHPAVDRVIPIALRRWRKDLFAAETHRQAAASKTELRAVAYDAIIDCQGLLKSALVARRARGPVWGPDRRSAREPLASFLYQHRIRVDFNQHAVRRSRILGAAALQYSIDSAINGGVGGETESVPRFGLRVPPLSDAERAALPPVYAVLLTNASRVTKQWPASRWRAVEACLVDLGLGSVLYWGSPAEQRETQARVEGMQRALVAPHTPLSRLASALAGARIVIGLDTGLTHLAAAVGAPTLGIFCDYDPALVGIVGDGPSRSLGGVNRKPEVDEVLSAVERLLAESIDRR
jgi:heptosyltransferase-1